MPLKIHHSTVGTRTVSGKAEHIFTESTSGFNDLVESEETDYFLIFIMNFLTYCLLKPVEFCQVV